ncbi:hypothetical protein F1642_12115 [Paracoccus sp. NBH48]|jgi:hypothetical protein|uniref:hypothetical protein n=1 Tax=Paracoccus sp. NBH48 TaxID=2596918 RepID=UPI000B2C47DF|nr:hypothetical protein [Paracoccus sp. NBH48]MBF5079734.1 hypothetical protein [Paracoccus sp. NBH48]
MAKVGTALRTGGVDQGFSRCARGGIFAAMTRMRHIATARTAPHGARLAVQLRGLLLLTLR